MALVQASEAVHVLFRAQAVGSDCSGVKSQLCQHRGTVGSVTSLRPSFLIRHMGMRVVIPALEDMGHTYTCGALLARCLAQNTHAT